MLEKQVQQGKSCVDRELHASVLFTLMYSALLIVCFVCLLALSLSWPYDDPFLMESSGNK